MNWFYNLNGEQQGPIAAEALIAKVNAGEITPSTLVWKEGLAEWTPFSAVTELQSTSANGDHLAQTAQTSQPATPYAPPSATPANALPPGVTIPTYLWQSIVATICCCWPFGIVGIVYASKVNSFLVQGDIAGATDASKKAKMWTNISAGLGLLFAVLYIIFVVVLGASSS